MSGKRSEILIGLIVSCIFTIAVVVLHTIWIQHTFTILPSDIIIQLNEIEARQIEMEKWRIEIAEDHYQERKAWHEQATKERNELKAIISGLRQ